MTRRRRIVLVFLLIVVGLVIGMWLFLSSSWSLSLGLRLASASLPGELTVAAYQGSLLGPVQLSNLRYRDQRVTVSLASAELDWRSLPLLYGKLALDKLSLADLNIDWHPVSKQPKHSAAPVLLPLSIDVREADIHRLSFHTAGPGEPVRLDELRFSARGVGQTIQLERFEVSGYGATARLAGELKLGEQWPMNLSLALRYDAANGRSYASKGRVQGDMQALTLHQELLGATPADLKVTARDILGKLHWHANLQIEKLNPHTLVVKLPDMQVGGTIEASGDLRQLHAQGNLQLHDRRLGQAQLTLRGDSDIRFSKYNFTASGKLHGKTIPPVSLNILGKGNRKELSLDKLELSLLHGTLDGQARLAWQPKLALNSDVRFSHIRTGGQFKDWPGEISGRLRLERKPATSLLPVSFDLLGVKGSLRNQPLSADIRGNFAPRQLQLHQLRVKLGDSLLQAKGRLDHRWDIGFQFKSAQLEQLLPAARGEVELSGSIHGRAATPRLQLQAQASKLGYARTRIKTLHLNMDMGLAKKDPAILDLQADELRFRGERWKHLSLQSSGSNVSQHIQLQAHNGKTRLQMRLHGGYVPWQWRGALDSLVIETPSHGVWQLQAPANIELARHYYKLAKLCIAQDKVYACGQVHWSGQSHLARLEAKQLPVALLNPWLPQQLKLEGEVDVQSNLQVTPRGSLQGQLDVHGPDKSMRLNFPGSKEQLVFGAVHLQARLDRKGLQAQWHLPLSKGGGLQAEFALPNWTPRTGLARSQALSAKLSLDGIPAELVTRMIPDLARAKGNLHVTLQIGGRLGTPQVSGKAIWQDGKVEVPALGLNVHDVKAELKTARPNTLLYEISARSGNGDLKIDGQTHLLPDKGWPSSIRLHAHNLEVSNISEAYIVVDSEAKMQIQGDSVDIDGDLTIPLAQLKPQSLPEGAVSASPDVIVIRKRRVISHQPNWKVSTRLRMQLGEKVDFNGFGIRGKLRGKLLLTYAPGKLMLGQGELNIVDGMYRMRGRDLTIRRGRLIFSNTFIDDPALDVEAVRNIENITAGVRLKGTLKQPQLTVFSEPAMPESEALAYLILGHSLEQSTQAEGQSINRTALALGFVAGDYLEKGIGGQLGLDELRVDVNQATQNTSLVVGKYLSPKLYLRYYNGIAQSSRLVQLQYQLSRRVQIQTESGYRGTQSITGGDIFFTIEY